MADGKVVIDIVAETKKYEDAVARLNSATQKQVSLMTGNMKTAGLAMTAALTAPLIALGIGSVKAAIDVENSMASLRKTTDLTEERYKELQERARETSEQHIVSQAQILELEALGGQLGILPEQLEHFSEIAAGFELATDIGAEEAATDIAQFSNITGMATEDAENFASTLVALGNNSATFESKILSMSMRVAGAGKQIGLTESQTLSLSAALSSAGIEAEAGGSAISTIMSQIDMDVAKQTSTLRVWAETANMSAAEFSQTWKNEPIVALQDVLAGMNDTAESGGNLNLVLDELGIGSIRQTDVLKRMSNASDMLNESVKTGTAAWQENTAFQEEVDKRLMTTESQLKMFQNQITNIAAEFGGPLIGAINGLLQGARPLLEIVGLLARRFAEMPAPLQSIIMGLGGTLAVIGPLTGAYGKVTESMMDFITRGQELKDAQDEIRAATKLADSAQKNLTVTTKKEAIADQVSVVAKKQAKLASLENTASKDKEALAKAREELATEKARLAEMQSVVVKGEEAAASGKVAAATTVEAAAVTADTEVKKRQITWTALATAAQQTFNAAMTSNPIGLVIAAIGILAPLVIGVAGAFGSASDAAEKAWDSVNGLTEGYKEWKKGIDDESYTFESLRQALDNTKAAEKELERIRSELKEETQETTDIYGEYGYQLGETSLRAADLRAQEEATLKVIDDYAVDTKGLVTKIREQSSATRTAKNLVREMGTEYDYAQSPLEDLGITMEDVKRAIIDQEEALQEHTEAIIESNAEIDSYAATHSYFAQALRDSGYAAEDGTLKTGVLTEHLAALGLSFDDLKGRVPSAVDTLRSGFEAMKDSEEVNIAKMQENMAANTEYLNNYTANIETLLANAGTDGQREMIMALKDMDPTEGAAIAHQLVNPINESIPAALESFAATWEANMTAEVNNAMAGVEKEVSAQSAQTMKETTSDAVQEGMIDGYIQGMNTAAPQITETVADSSGEAAAAGITESTPVVQAAWTETLTTSAEAAAAEMDPSTFGSIAENLAASIASGKGAVSAATVTLLNAAIAIFNAQSFVPYGTAKVLQLSDGLKAGKPTVESVSRDLATAIKNALIDSATSAYGIGLDTASGVARGMSDGGGAVSEAARAFMRRALDAAKAEADVRSPAHKWADQLGVMLPRGTAEGIERDTPAVELASEHMMQAGMRGARKGLEHLFADNVVLGDMSASALVAPITAVASIGAQAGSVDNSQTDTYNVYLNDWIVNNDPQIQAATRSYIKVLIDKGQI
jgi:TP901 family phage tail tape measure protein